ncbi:MAG: RelE/StbE family addiction module toxin [Parcubacteria group bacterium Gr01-1014_17]|nr:MAG: RelE/StbE family addiction module toxin [Parcubacteria group bacterium Gr01-1014_17]
MTQVAYKATFVRQLDKLELYVQTEVLEKIEQFKDSANHRQLKVHKLHGQLKDFYSFSVNYRLRIIFEYLSKNEVVLLAVGDHEVYR